MAANCSVDVSGKLKWKSLKKSGKSYLAKIFSDKTNYKIFEGGSVNKNSLDL